MSRSVWKGPFVEESLIKKVEKIKNDTNKKPIKTWSRKSTIIPDFVGYSFLIYNGKKLIPITVLPQLDNFLDTHLQTKKQKLKAEAKEMLKNKNE